MCKKCGKPILSNSCSGQSVELFLLEYGEVIDRMSGEYDSYGRVFTKDRKDSVKWNRQWGDGQPDDDESNITPSVCSLMCDFDVDSGIAAIHTKCFDGKIPSTFSENDPNQGWGTEDEDLCDVCGGSFDDHDCVCGDYNDVICSECGYELCSRCGGCCECDECECEDE